MQFSAIGKKKVFLFLEQQLAVVYKVFLYLAVTSESFTRTRIQQQEKLFLLLLLAISDLSAGADMFQL